MSLCFCGSATFTTTSSPIDTIECGQTLTGSVGDNPDSVSFAFVNDAVQDVTFTDCDSGFDPKLFLLDSAGNYIQDQSTNGCDGDDCYDDAYCSTSYRETFTMSDLEEGAYTLLLTPWNSGGDWSVTVYCDSTTNDPETTSATMDTTETTGNSSAHYGCCACTETEDDPNCSASATCTAAVTEVDTYCGTGSWDGVCAAIAEFYCEGHEWDDPTKCCDCLEATNTTVCI